MMDKMYSFTSARLLLLLLLQGCDLNHLRREKNTERVQRIKTPTGVFTALIHYIEAETGVCLRWLMCARSSCLTTHSILCRLEEYSHYCGSISMSCRSLIKPRWHRDALRINMEGPISFNYIRQDVLTWSLCKILICEGCELSVLKRKRLYELKALHKGYLARVWLTI